ncbi:MAG TPA: response regulator transcription factor, partial [Actinomycetota bacterium]|nr:response regulator transcription factor [Actinomycetota bacterium]
LEEADTPEAHDGLARALWWQGVVDGAIEHRERAYAQRRERGEPAEAARLALWLAREYLEAVGNEPASGGWVARAAGLLRGQPEGPAHGWLELTYGTRTADPAEMRSRAEAALELARRLGDPNLEASALALVGRGRILDGQVDDGLAALDEAMTVATAGEVTDPLVFGDVCCVVTLACEEAGELDRLMRWGGVLEAYLERNQHGGLLSFCGTCTAELFAARGDFREAENCLVFAIRALEGTGHRSRCIQPAAKLAELRIVQGRIEEAERLLTGYEDLPESLLGSVAIHRSRGEHAVAAALLLRRLNQVGDTLLAVPLLSTLVEVQLDAGDAEAASASAGRLRSIAQRSDHPRLAALADLAAGRVARAVGDPDGRGRLERALATFTRSELPLAAARTRVELASLLRSDDPEVAAREARLALETFERLGAAREADAIAALVRELGGPARTGPKDIGLLTAREAEVLELLGDGLSNAEVAARLYISTKTAGNHVSSILSKLHLRSRQEAAAYAVRAGRDLDRRQPAQG